MLQFLKKSAAASRKKSTHCDGAAGPENVNKSTDEVTANVANGCVTATEEPVSDEEALQEAERFWLEYEKDSAPTARKSRLSRSLLDILTEQSCICYFVQFLETKNSLPLIKFWLEVEGFKAAAAETVRLSNGKLSKSVSHRGLNRSMSSDGYDTLSYLSVDCDSISTFSENAFDDVFTQTSTTEDGDPGCRTSGSCTPIQPPLEVVIEEERKPKPRVALADDKKQMLEVCDLTLRQSLTDDEKTQICETSKLKLEEHPARDNGFNSLINSDAVRIYRKFLVSHSPYHIEVPATILSNISLALCGGICSERIFDDAQHYLVEVLEKNYLNQFLESCFYCKYTFDVLSSDSLSLTDILCSEMALFYFMEYLEQKDKRHTLEFCVSASHFHKSAENCQAQDDAVVLYQKYVSLQATCSLNLSDKVRFIIEEQICSQNAATIKSCFELPSRIIERFLERRYLKGFLISTLYTKYLSELMGKISANPANDSNGSFGILAGRKQTFTTDRTKLGGQRRGHRKTFSDVTNESTSRAKHSFISSQNTLLAMSDASFHRKRLNPVASNSSSTTASNDIMQIDSRHLYNPDLLWRRNSVSGLTFGRVDALGRYERDFDLAEPPQEDDRWSKNRLKKAVRKWVNLPEDKAQEELAWQVAEMIVKDITSVTMSGTDGNSSNQSS